VQHLIAKHARPPQADCGHRGRRARALVRARLARQRARARERDRVRARARAGPRLRARTCRASAAPRAVRAPRSRRRRCRSRDYERAALERALAETHGDARAAARRLGIGAARSTASSPSTVCARVTSSLRWRRARVRLRYRSDRPPASTRGVSSAARRNGSARGERCDRLGQSGWTGSAHSRRGARRGLARAGALDCARGARDGTVRRARSGRDRCRASPRASIARAARATT
jgi:hypothetical protein